MFYTISNVTYAISVGTPAPEINLSGLNGEKIKLSDLKGKIVLVDFWASWCHPCREANPVLAETYLKYHHKGFEILSVSLDDNKSNWVKAIEKDKLPWRLHASDLKGWDSEVIETYKVEALPTSYLIDRDGKIIVLDPFAEDLALELEEIFLKELSFYPKNASNTLYLSIPTKYIIKNQSNKKLLKGEGDEIDISELENGVYIISFGGKEERFLKKEAFSKKAIITFSNNEKITFSAKTEFEVYQINGNLIRKGNADFVDVSNLDVGEYFIHLKGNVEKYIKK